MRLWYFYAADAFVFMYYYYKGSILLCPKPIPRRAFWWNAR